MRALGFDGGHLVRLDRGEGVTESLTAFLKEREIRGGWLSGIGGVENAELGFYDLASRTYRRRRVEGTVELIHYAGNITMLDGEPFIHAHAVVSGADFRPLSGHFFEARVAVTGEFVIRPAAWGAKRGLDDVVGLNLIDPD